MPKIALFASGSGTNADNIMKFFHGHPTVKVALILSDQPEAGVHQRAKKWGVPTFCFSGAELKEGTPVLRRLADYDISFIVLSGFLRMIPPAIITAYPSKIINIHPALLPKYGGKGMYGAYVHEAVVAAKEKQSGITIHYVNERYDEGAIIFQASCPVLPSDTADDVARKVHELEYAYFPEVIERLLIIGSADAQVSVPDISKENVTFAKKIM